MYEAQFRLPGAWLLSEERRPTDGRPARVTSQLLVGAGDQIHLEARYAPNGLRQFRASYHQNTGTDRPEPRLLAIASGDCTIHSGRTLRSEGPIWRYLDQLDSDLSTVRWTETLQAPWPLGRDTGGVRVGLVDTGLAYDLPIFRTRLARDAQGVPLGYDFWDLDPHPYDGDVARGPFLPIRHGTAVASVIALEAPDAALVPFRFPRPDMARMGDLVRAAQAADVRILAMPLGSNDPDDWTAFADAIAGTDILAIISAGNNGRDIDQNPIWPAALGLGNALVVTSSDARGRVADGSNWGVNTVDIMLPAENVPVVDFRGAKGVTSGTSFAVPRLAALAARILTREPDLSVEELKARIASHAITSPFASEPSVAVGWIPNPTTSLE